MSSVNIVNFDQFHNSDLEHYAYNLIHFFLDKHGYTILNVEDKILENFNNSYYNIIYIYTHPLINDVNIDDLMEKVDLIKYNLKRQFFLFNQRILIITLNCSIDVEQIDLPKNVDIVNASDKSQLTKDNILTQYYPDIVDYPFDLDPAMLAYRINNLSMAYINQVSQAFNRKDKYVNIILGIIIVIIYLYQFLLNMFEGLPDIYPYLLLTKGNIEKFWFYTLITNNLVSLNYITVFFSIFFIITIGLRLERIYGSLRYLAIIASSMIFTNAMIFAFAASEAYLTGFTPIIYAFLGAFILVIIYYRRFLAMLLKRIILYSVLLLLLLVLLGDTVNIIALLSAFIAGFVSSFVIGLPNHKGDNKLHRIVAGVCYLVLVVFGLFIGLK